MTKDNIRKRMLIKRKQIDPKRKTQWDEKIYNAIIQDRDYINSETVFLFHSFNYEIETRKLIEHALNASKRVYIPRVEGPVMRIYQIRDLSNLVKNSMGILEPGDLSKPFDEERIDFILMPGLAFDKKGGRIGYGGGFYDRFLMSLESLDDISKVAIAYDFQVIDYVPMSKHDIPVDRIITERGTYDRED